MKDMYGRILDIGDKVIYVQNATKNPRLQTGTVKSIYPNDYACTVDHSTNIYSNRIAKLPIPEEL